MPDLTRGRYRARLATSEADLWSAQRLRQRCFRPASNGPDPGDRDTDAFDASCSHVLVEEVATATLVCCFRLLPLNGGGDIYRSYAAQFYDLAGLADYPGPMVEMGRFCIHPDWHDPDILRMAWAEMTGFVDRHGIELLFGCSSFRGTRPELYADAFALLKQRHLAPDRWRPGEKAPQLVRFARHDLRQPDLKRARAALPPLLKTYLLMGGWVSDHAVIDHDLDTLHVFTGVETRAVPPARARLLRSLAG